MRATKNRNAIRNKILGDLYGSVDSIFKGLRVLSDDSLLKLYADASHLRLERLLGGALSQSANVTQKPVRPRESTVATHPTPTGFAEVVGDDFPIPLH